MPFSDWTHTSVNAITYGIQAASPIKDSGSLEVEDASVGVSTLYTGYYTSSHGFTKGRIRTLLRVEEEVVGGIDQAFVALFSMTAGLTAIGGALYAMYVSTGTTDNFRLIRSAVGIGTAITELNTGSKSFSVGDILPIEYEWNLDLAGIGGIALVARAGNVGDTDFSNLATVCGVSEFTTPIATTMSEGIGVNCTSGSSVRLKFDETEVYSGV